MPLVTLSVQHRYTLEEARQRLETAVAELTSRFGTLVRRVEWSPDRTQARLEGSGVWMELRLEGQVVHATADIPMLGRFLGGSVTTRLREILQRTFQLQLRGGKEDA
jgi:hypothetical protein